MDCFKDFFCFSTLAYFNNGIWTLENGREVRQPLRVIIPNEFYDCKCDWIAEYYLLKIFLNTTSDISVFVRVKYQVIFLS